VLEWSVKWEYDDIVFVGSSKEMQHELIELMSLERSSFEFRIDMTQS